MLIEDVLKINWKQREGSGLIDRWYNVQACLESEEENSLELNTQSFYDSDQSNDDLGQLPEDEFVNLSGKLLLETVNKVKKNVSEVEEVIKKTKFLKKITPQSLEQIKKGLILLWVNFNSDLGIYLNPVINQKLEKQDLTKKEIKKIKDFYFSVRTPLSYLKQVNKQKSPMSLMKLTKKDQQFLELTNQHIYLDNYSGDLYTEIETYLTKLIFREYGIKSLDLAYYSLKDLEDLIKQNIKLSKKEIKDRHEFKVMVKINSEIGFFYGKKDFEMIKKVLNFSKEINTDITLIKGMSASLGKVSGRVKIINYLKDMHKLKKGEVLVSVMTRPELMVAIKKAGAIVTDIGGVTSHAAIIARELNIPCIVGTKIATQVLKDGDLVEVDANKGVVKRLFL